MSAEQEPSAKPVFNRPDLDVTFIERNPKYPAYTPIYDLEGHQDVPILCYPGTRTPIPEAEIPQIKRWPAPGEEVTFTAHVVNKGDRPCPAFEFAWFIDGRRVREGTHAEPLEPGAVAQEEFRWVWEEGRHTVKFVADPHRKMADAFRHNNAREDFTDALNLFIGVDRVTYESFNAHRNLIGTYSFEDWVQYHLDTLNQLFAEAVYPATPEGCPERVRIDRLVVFEGQSGWDETFKDLSPLGRGHDGGWWFGRNEHCAEWAAGMDWGLLHEWGHQLGLTDLYVLDVASESNLVADEHGDPLLIGREASRGGMMKGHGPVGFSDLCAAALAAQYARHRRRGYYGDFYYCIPEQNAVEVLDRHGEPVAGAYVAFYQRGLDQTLQGEPTFEGVTNAKGRFTLPNRPAPHLTTPLGFTQSDNPFGHIHVVGLNGVFFIKIRARGQTCYDWLDLPQFNMAYFNGQRHLATFPLATLLPGPNAPPAPEGVTAAVRQGEVHLNWQGRGGEWGKESSPAVEQERVAFNVYCAEPILYRYRRVAQDLTAPEFVHTPAYPGVYRYAVTAVVEGRESAFSPDLKVAVLGQPWGLALDPTGRRYLRDVPALQTLVEKPDGSVIGYLGSVHEHFEGSYDHCLDSLGRLIVADLPDGYSQEHRITILDRQFRRVNRFGGESGSEPGRFNQPRGVAVDRQDNIIVADTGNHRLQFFDREGHFLFALGRPGSGDGEFQFPMKAAAAPDGRLAVADSGNNRVQVFRPVAGGYEFVRALAGLSEPKYVAFAPDGTLLVSDSGHHAIKAFDADGNLRWEYGGPERDPLNDPRGIAVDPTTNTLVIVDGGSRRVVTWKLP